MDTAHSETALSPAPSHLASVDTWDRTVETFLGAKVSNPHTLTAYTRHLDSFVGWCRSQGIPSPAGISPAVLAEYRGVIMGRGLAPSSSAQEIAAVRAFVGWCRAFDSRLPDAAQLKAVFSTPKTPTQRPYSILTPREVGAVLDSAAAAGLRDETILSVMIGAGLRVSEVVSLSPSSVRESYDGAVVLEIVGKGGKARTVPLGEDLAALLRAYMASTGRTIDARDKAPLFVAADRAKASRAARPLTRQAVDQSLRRILKAAGVQAKALSAHSLRHTFAVRYLDAGGDVRALQKILGHASLATTQRYVDHLDTTRLSSTMPPLRAAT